MRKLDTVQKIRKLNDVYSYDTDAVGQESNLYVIVNKDDKIELDSNPLRSVYIPFQNDPRNHENSLWGIIDTDLLEIVKDRLTAFQAGDNPHEYNRIALGHVTLALRYLNERVKDRNERGVLGTTLK